MLSLPSNLTVTNVLEKKNYSLTFFPGVILFLGRVFAYGESAGFATFYMPSAP